MERHPDGMGESIRSNQGIANGLVRSGNLSSHSLHNDPCGDIDDHMQQSHFLPDDICPACHGARGSSVWCPSTHRHHGTDAAVSSAGSSPGKALFMRLLDKLPHIGDGDSPNGGEDAVTNPTAEPLHDTKSIHKRPTSCPDYLDHLGSLSASSSAAVLQSQSAAQRGRTKPTSAALESPLERQHTAANSPQEVQYYSYVGEDGQTYYYVAEGVAGDVGAEETAAAEEVEEPQEDAAETYIYECVDEEGNTIQYICTREEAQQAGLAEPSAVGSAPALGVEDGEEEEPARDASKTSSKRKGHGPGDAIKRKKDALVSAISGLFGKSKKHTEKSSGAFDEDRSGDDSTSTPPPGPTAVDAEVAEFVASLMVADRKRFEKERMHRVKELEEAEKKAREKLKKDRKSFVLSLERERRAFTYESQAEIERIKKAQKKSKKKHRDSSSSSD